MLICNGSHLPTDSVTAFIARWSTPSPSERANSQLFLSELCDLVGIPHPATNLHPSP